MDTGNSAVSSQAGLALQPVLAQAGAEVARREILHPSVDPFERVRAGANWRRSHSSQSVAGLAVDVSSPVLAPPGPASVGTEAPVCVSAEHTR